MNDVQQVVFHLFKGMGVSIPPERVNLFEAFVEGPGSKELVERIMQNGQMLMAKWKVKERVEDVLQLPFRIPNATVGKPYEAVIDTKQFPEGISILAIPGLEELGLSFDPVEGKIKGMPVQSGDRQLSLQFKIEGQEEEAPLNEKGFTFIINPDPKSLWKALDSNREDPYWKEDNVTLFSTLGDRHILVSSKRGRSHANQGGFREDDFAFSDLAGGWNIVVVADGAGSAKVSRKGSSIACSEVVEHFKEHATEEAMTGFEEILQQYHREETTESAKNLNHFIYNNLGKAAFRAHKKLEEFGKAEGFTLKDLSTTLIFCLWKKFDIGYAFLSFGVGDCPIAVLNRDVSEVALLNWLDVGEFGGGTRFITMPEIFSNEKFATRFGFKLMDDFSYLMLMSDGIYDPKFVVEAALEDVQKWKDLLADLDGNNAEGTRVELRSDNTAIQPQFSQWMDFWSPGNHDDRTLAIVF